MKIERSLCVPELTVILPAYDAGLFIAKSVATLSSYLDDIRLSYEILVVNDGSTDETARCLIEVEDETTRVISLPSNQGKGVAIKHGIEFAKGRCIVVTDADIPYGLESIVQCYKALREGAVLAIGDRTLPESRNSTYIPLPRRLVSSIFSVLVKLLLYDSGICDTQCGLKGFRSCFARQLLRYSRINRFAFDLEIIVFAIENRISIARLPVVLSKNGPSSVRIFADSLRGIKDFFQILWIKWQGHYRIATPGQSRTL